MVGGGKIPWRTQLLKVRRLTPNLPGRARVPARSASLSMRSSWQDNVTITGNKLPHAATRCQKSCFLSSGYVVDVIDTVGTTRSWPTHQVLGPVAPVEAGHITQGAGVALRIPLIAGGGTLGPMLAYSGTEKTPVQRGGSMNDAQLFRTPLLLLAAALTSNAPTAPAYADTERYLAGLNSSIVWEEVIEEQTMLAERPKAHEAYWRFVVSYEHLHPHRHG